MMDVYDKTQRATDYSRRNGAPCVILYDGLTRRFGHAATDRQSAYLSEARIRSMADARHLESALVQVVEVHNCMTYSELHDRFREIRSWTIRAFDEASEEGKVTRRDMMERVSPPAIPVRQDKPQEEKVVEDRASSSISSSNYNNPNNTGEKKEIMRKHMTRVIDECLGRYEDVVYLGEDVKHGGYYLVTDGLAAKYEGRVLDFPPVSTFGWLIWLIWFR